MANKGDLISFIIPLDTLHDLIHEDTLALRFEDTKMGIEVKEIAPVIDEGKRALEVSAIVIWTEGDREEEENDCR